MKAFSLSAGLALVQFHVIAFVLGGSYGRSVTTAHDVLLGRPHWRVYQSRVLSPYLIDTLTPLFGSFLAAHVFVSIVALILAGLVAWRIGQRLADTRGAVASLLVFHASFALLLSRPWLIAWDYLDALVFLIFLDFVLSGRSWRWFVGLFAIAVFNHEIALFIPVWLVCEAVVRRDRVRGVAGVVSLASGMVILESLRRLLLVQEMGPTIFLDAPSHAGGSFHFRLFDNLARLAMVDNQMLVVGVFLLGVLAIAGWLAWQDPTRFLGLALMQVALIGSLLTFGVVQETRLYVVLIPLYVLGSAHVCHALSAMTTHPLRAQPLRVF